MAYNICYTTILEDSSVIEDDKVNHFHIDMDASEIDDGKEDESALDDNENEKKEDKKITAHYRYVKKDVYEGVLPRLVGRLVNERRAVRKMLEGNKDPIMKIILDKRQLALKVSANSVFGFLGVKNGKLSLIPLAMSITAKGRELIGQVNTYLEDKYNGKIVYNDTDSSMVDLGIKDTKLCNEWGYRLADEISKLFPPPLRIEYEKSMTLLALKKKKYAAFLVDKHGNLKKNKKDILVRGIILARRDTLPWLQNVYSDLLYNILCRQTMIASLKMIYTAVEDMMSGKFDVKGIVIVRQLSAFYKSESYFLNVFAKRLKSLGHLVNAGDRLEYLIVKNPGEKLLGNRMVTLDMYLEGGYELDTLYYLDHNLKNPIDQLFSVGHKEELKEYEDLGFRTKRKFLSVSKPIAMMVEAFKNGYKLEDVKEFLSIEN